MLLFFIIILLVIIISLKIKLKIKILWSTFFHKGVKTNDSKFGVYCYHGKQGSTKTASCVKFLLEQKEKLGYEVYANIKSLKNTDYYYFNGLEGLLSLRNKSKCIIFYDEIFTLLTKNSKMTNDILDFLSQMRKREIIFITTAQEWLEINMTLRRYCKYDIYCRKINLPFFCLSLKRFGNAEDMKWSEQDNEYVSPIIKTTISKLNKRYLNLYDTFEQINPNDVCLPTFISSKENTITTTL